MEYIIGLLVWFATTVAILVFLSGGKRLKQSHPDPKNDPDDEIQQDDFTTSIEYWGKIHENRIH